MLTEYFAAAMQHAEYEYLDEDEGWFGHVVGLDGVWANASTKEETEKELRSTLEDWVLLGLRFGDPIPAVDGINLNVTLQPTEVA